ncbi:MAG: hypothetical protein EVA57_04760 [alpha proteobacterium HIMB59]|nr:MAG: hypothetical protein EVA57_04760 [alpha proteobacterium HIMB59]
MKKKIQFILNKPQLSENIGMSIRSIGCFGFENLDLVNPRNLWPNDKGLKSAKHFEKIAKKVKTFTSIPDAIQKSDIVIATTVRPRDIQIPYIKLEDINKIKSKKISIIFGQENNGLNNKEISYANYILTLPTHNQSSLNLSHAVSIVAFHINQLNLKYHKKFNNKLITSNQIEQFVDFIMKTLNKKGFTTIPAKSQNLEISLRNFLKTNNINEKILKTAYGVLKFLAK